MKILTIFFASYFMVLSILPCGDSITLNLKSSADITMQQSQNHEEKHHDVCSPFCVCNCCRVTADIAFQPMSILNIAPRQMFSKKIPERNYALITLFDQNIWQPPKITV